MKLRVTPAVGEPFDFELEVGSIVVGRSSTTADLVLDDPYASRQHARLTRRGDSLFVEDLGSRNGTRLTDAPVVGTVEVGAGELIRISGSSILRVAEDLELSGTIAPVDSALITRTSATRSAATILGEDSSEALDLFRDAAALRDQVARLRTLRAIHRAFSRVTRRDDLLPAILDWAFMLFSPRQSSIFLRTSGGDLRNVASRSVGTEPQFLLPEGLVSQVMEGGLAVTATVVGPLAVDATSAQAEAETLHLAAAPLLDDGASMGMLLVVLDAPLQPLETQIDLLVELAGEGALELRKMALAEEAEQRRVLDRELELARLIQLDILGELPDFEGYSFMSRNVPSRGVSGDFYLSTLRADGEECVLVVGDVSGKGFSAALLTASAEALASVMVEAGDAPADICTKLSRQLYGRTRPSSFVTAFVAALDRRSGLLTYTNAGHNAALLLLPDGSVEKLHSLGLPLAVMPDAVYESRQVLLEPDATLLLYTDGVSEAAGREDEEYGLARLEACFARHSRDPLGELLTAIEQDVDAFVGGLSYADDRTLLLIRRERAV